MRIPIDELVDAFLEGDHFFQFYFNKETNEVFVPLEGEDLDDEDHIYPIPYKSSDEMYGVMVKFSRQTNDEVEEKLFIALNKRKPFSQFKQVVTKEGLLDKWYDFERAYAKQQILDWIETI